jgi:hypothetical protein
MDSPPVVATDRRRSVRFSTALPAAIWIGADVAVHPCTMLDISLHGCRLRVEPGDSIPDQFTVLLTHSGTVRRPCKVIWRKDDLLGVEFVDGPGQPSALNRPEGRWPSPASPIWRPRRR